MGNVLYLIVVGLVAIWAVGFFSYQAGGLIHLLLVAALLLVIVKLVQGKRF